jgi:hypothetical protein
MAGTVWLQYRPTGATWCYFIDSITAGLSPPGSPERWNVVIAGNTWPPRLSTGQYMAGPFPQQTVAARLTAIASAMNADTGIILPPVSSSIANDPHLVPPTVQDPASSPASGYWPSYLQQARDAAALGLCWLDAGAAVDLYTPGTLWLDYVMWDSAPARAIDEAQYNAGTAWSFGFSNVKTRVAWAATTYLSAASSLDLLSAGYGVWGVEKMSVRIWGDVGAGKPQEAPCRTITQTIFDTVGSPKTYVNQMMATSGDRMHPDGSPGAPWDPAAHVWRPNEVMTWLREGKTERYRVTQTSHRLTVWRWESMHTLEVYLPAAAMPT